MIESKLRSGGGTGFTAHTFTNAGQTGTGGPSQSQINSAYLGSDVAGLVTITSYKQVWVVPADGTYRITAAGASGGGNSTNAGKGAIMIGTFTLSFGDSLEIGVGQTGSTGSYGGGAGSSGIRSGSSLLIVAGGGGGGTGNTHGTADGVTGPNGQNVSASLGGTNGQGGDFGQPPTDWPRCAGGAGVLSDGLEDNTNPNFGNGGSLSGAGGTGGHSDAGFGFTGGGGGYYGGGGGGGYSGGAGGYPSDGGSYASPGYCSGGGGGSINIGSNQSNTQGGNNGYGFVTIEAL
tara:strand:- start:562 stop:1431 length:870 start_codon:yes stop_codon:yes gene_type:complete